jgi:hypothetical protein
VNAKVTILAKRTHVRVAAPAVLAVVAAGLGGVLTMNHNETVVREDAELSKDADRAGKHGRAKDALVSGYARAAAAPALLAFVAGGVGGAMTYNHNETLVRDATR